jgi:hypothetical protein
MITEAKAKEGSKTKEGSGGSASEKQIAYILTLCKKLGKQDVFDEFVASSPTIAMAQEMIEKLKELQDKSSGGAGGASGWKKFGKK